MEKPTLPKWISNLLESVLPESMAEFVIGDLEEYYSMHCEQKGRFMARFIMIWSVFTVFLSFAFKKSSSNSYSMYSHYLKVALRNLRKQRLYTTINVSGIAVGVASFILISLYVAYEMSYDQFHPNSDNIYQVIQQQPGNEYIGSDLYALTPAAFGDLIKQELPQVVRATSMARRPFLIEGETRNFREWGFWIDGEFLDIFQTEFISGDPNHALDLKEGIILTETTAQKLFGEVDPIGKRLSGDFWNSRFDMQVTAVVVDPPSNSSFEYAFIANLEMDKYYVKDKARPTFQNNAYNTFLMVQDGVDLSYLEQEITQIFLSHRDLNVYDENAENEKISLISLLDIHLNGGINFNLGSQKANTQYLLFFSVIAVIVLVLSCINYMNIAIASSISRVREVGMRKAIGAYKSQIVGQFWGESIVVSFLAVLIGVVIAYWFAPVFGEVIQRPIQVEVVGQFWLIPGLIFLVLLIGLIAGSYPALVISKLKPSSILKGIQIGKMGNVKLQKVLIVFQFAASVLLITGSLFTYKQLQYISNKDLGFNKENVVAISASNLSDVTNVFRDQVASNPNVLNFSTSTYVPVDIGSSAFMDLNTEDKNDDVLMYTAAVDGQFLETYDVELVAGRTFNSPDENACVVNETGLAKLGLTAEEALGKVLDGRYESKIVGVIKDFHMHALREPIAPLMLRNIQEGSVSYWSLKIKEDKVQETFAQLADQLSDLSPNPSDIRFVDDHFNQLYRQEYQLADVFGFFTVIAVSIACMGLFGLAALAISKRSKEVSIRKVLGASAMSIVSLLSRDFLVLVGVSFIIAVPVAWYFVSRWLENYAYHMEMNWAVFLLAGFIALCLAMLAIVIQTVKATRRNPVDGLRTE